MLETAVLLTSTSFSLFVLAWGSRALSATAALARTRTSVRDRTRRGAEIVVFALAALMGVAALACHLAAGVTVETGLAMAQLPALGVMTVLTGITTALLWRRSRSVELIGVAPREFNAYARGFFAEQGLSPMIGDGFIALQGQPRLSADRHRFTNRVTLSAARGGEDLAARALATDLAAYVRERAPKRTSALFLLRMAGLYVLLGISLAGMMLSTVTHAGLIVR